MLNGINIQEMFELQQIDINCIILEKFILR